MLDQSPHVCVSCNTPFTGRFCNNCGEKVVNEKDRSILHFFSEFVHLLTHADSKFLRTLKYLFTRPGFLSSEYIKGRRKLYSTPMTLFFT